ncbi:MAG: SDR family NAD(P)-dependent oxidoreductase, partial [Terrimicrobiaceae bacterium]
RRRGRGRHVALPLHPWKHERHWHEAAESVATRLGPASHPLLGRTLNTAEPVWESPLTMKLLPYLADHRLNGRGVFPAAAYVEMALAAGHELFPDVPPVFEDIDFLRALFLPDPDQTARLEFRANRTDGAFQINAQAGASRAWTTHCTGKIRAGSAARLEAVSLREIQSRCTEERSGATSYEAFEKNGFHFGESFRGIARIWRRDGEALGEISPPPSLKTGGYCVHPALLDSCFQVLLSALPPAEGGRGLFLPAHLGRMRLLARPAGNIWSHVRLVETKGRTITADIQLLDGNGVVLAEIKGFRCSALDQPAEKANELDECFYEVAWRESDPEAAPPAVASGSWLLVGGESALSQAVAARLNSFAFVADASGIDDQLTGNIDHVVYFASSSDDAASASLLCAELLALVQKLAVRGGAARLTVVTRAAQPVEDTISPAQGALLGLARVVMNEHQEMNCRVIDLGAVESDAETAGLVAELLHGGEEEVALRGARRLVPRLVRGVPKPRTISGDATPFRLEIVKPGALDQTEFRVLSRRPPQAGEVEIEVEAAGLNFRDVMKVLGIYPIEETADHLLGDECSGRVVAVGSGVGHVSEGDEVLAISPGSFAQYVSVPSAFVVKKPGHLSAAEAATIPVTFLTAHYALHHLARIEPGERVLIHAAAGGVGLAALQIARLAGAEIFATAGSDEKRALVRSLGAAHVMDSRSLDFADEVMEITGGRGVDVVLNSLAGEALTKSVGVLAPYGRFLEIGKRDIYQNSRLGLRPFSRNLSFFAIDLSRLLQDRPAFIGQMLADLMRQFAAHELRPLPKKVYPIVQAADAFREMASGKHTGKIVFSLADAAAIPVQPAPDETIRFHGDASYLITGGVGGFGLAVADWMIEQGARNLVLVGSRETSAASARKHFEQAAAPGVNILARAVDVSDAAALDGLFAEISTTLPPLAGVIHGAMKIDDGVLQQLNPERFHTAMAPKADGAWNLHLRTRGLPLDFFVMFSSIASLVGNPGQGNYAAANAFLDALTYHRRTLGLPAQTVNWGHLGGVGYVSRNAHVSEYLNRHGIPELAPHEALELLGRVLRSDVPRVAVMRMDWGPWAEANPRLKKSPRYSELVSLEVPEESGEALSGGVAAILRASGSERQKLLETYIQETAARVLRLPASTLSVTQPLSDFGLDSLMSIELINRIEEGLAVRFPVERIRGGPSIVMLAKILAGALPAQRPA